MTHLAAGAGGRRPHLPANPNARGPVRVNTLLRPRPAPEAEAPRTIARAPIHEQILPHLRRDIVHNRWQPGDRLPEPVLCEEFGISRTPLRHAFKILAAEGLLRLMPHVGAVVAEAETPDLAEKFEVVMALERLAAGKVARLRPPAVLKELQRLHDGMARAAAAGDVDAYYGLNDAFHRAIVLGAGNATLAREHEVMMSHVHRARHLANTRAPLQVDAAGHHDALLAAIRAGAEEVAGRAMVEHLAEVARNMLGEGHG